MLHTPAQDVVSIHAPASKITGMDLDYFDSNTEGFEALFFYVMMRKYNTTHH